MRDVYKDIQDERKRQDKKWGEQNHPDGTGGVYYERQALDQKDACDRAAKLKDVTWDLILLEEVYEAMEEEDETLLRAELVQVAAVAVSWIQAIDRRKAKP